jgi:hypothetical protein
MQGHTDRVEFACLRPSSCSSGDNNNDSGGRSLDGGSQLSASQPINGGGGGGEALLLTGGRDCTLHLWDLSASTGASAKKSRVYTYDSIASGRALTGVHRV